MTEVEVTFRQWNFKVNRAGEFVDLWRNVSFVPRVGEFVRLPHGCGGMTALFLVRDVVWEGKTDCSVLVTREGERIEP